MWQPWDRTFRGHLSEEQLRIFFFLQLSSPSGLAQQIGLSFLVPDLHPTALLYYEHLKNRNCVLLTFVCTWH